MAFRYNDSAEHLLNAISVAVVPVLLIAPSYTGFVLWRWQRIRHWYRKRAREAPELRVPTAGSILDKVIGRSQLCEVLIENVRHSATRRPNVLVGGIGTGKTAVLVEMTRLLAERGAVPVAIRLRDAVEDLDFNDLAFKRFKDELDQRLYTDAIADRLWRQLRQEDLVVVLADGLEEALIDPHKCEDRETAIRLAVRNASEQRLALIIASRPHDPLRGLEAALTELEPLGEGPALDYLMEGGRPTERRSLTRLVQMADISAAPLYLQLLRQTELIRHRRVPEGGRDWLSSVTDVDTTGAIPDRTKIRLGLLDQWRELLEQGYLYEDYALRRELRQQTFLVLSALACIGLRNDRMEIEFEDLIGARTEDDRLGSTGPHHPTAIAVKLKTELIDLKKKQAARRGVQEEPDRAEDEADLGVSVDEALCALSATMGCELGIVEAKERSVRFRHSLIQAYMATSAIRPSASLLDVALTDRTYVERALDNCGREFLIALVMNSRRESPNGTGCPSDVQPEMLISHELQGLATRPDPPAREAKVSSHAYTGSVDITEESAGNEVDIRAVLTRYSNTQVTIPVDWLLELRRAASKHSNRVKRLQMYAALLEIDSYHSRTMVREIVAELNSRWRAFQLEHADVQDRALLDAKTELMHMIGQATRWICPPTSIPDPDDPGVINYVDFFEIGVQEDDDQVRFIIAQEIGEGGQAAYQTLQSEFQSWWDWWRDRWRFDCEAWKATSVDATFFRKGRMCAWLAPSLFQPDSDSSPTGPTPVDERDRANSAENLKRWLRDFLSASEPRCREKRPWISMEIALAQGFKLAANRRPGLIDPHQDRGAVHSREALIECAEEALKYSRYWYAQLTLIQALTLLSLPADPAAPLTNRGHGADPRAHAAHWIRIAGSGFADQALSRPVHPMVRQAGELAIDALITRRPQLFCWMDETDTVGRVGSVSPPDQPLHDYQQWILPSAGWRVLDSKAQRLLGDVVLLLSLSDRGSSPTEREERLMRSDRPVLPPCMTRDRTSLDVTRTVGSAAVSDPGSNCHDDCDFALCPYPPVGARPFRKELGEGFCRALRTSGEKPEYAPQLSNREYREFWEQMSQRVRPRRDTPGAQPLKRKRTGRDHRT